MKASIVMTSAELVGVLKQYAKNQTGYECQCVIVEDEGVRILDIDGADRITTSQVINLQSRSA